MQMFARLLSVIAYCGLGVGSHRKYPSMSLWTTQTRAGLPSGSSGGQALSLGAGQWSTSGPL